MEKSFFYKNITIRFSDSGKGKTIVLLHGFLENKDMWKPILPVFEGKYRVIAIDLLGHGKTDCLSYVHTMEDQAEMVFAVLNSLKIKKPTFIGHSMGGYVALAFAELYPGKIKSLVLLNSTSKADNVEKKRNRDRAIVAVKYDYTTFVRLAVANLFSIENNERLSTEIENTKLDALKTPLQGIIAALEGMKIRKSREVILQTSTFPILLILGKKDSVLDFETTKIQVENSNAKLISLSGGHMSHLENKDDLIVVLSDFLKKNV